MSTDFQALKQFFQVVSVIFCAIIRCFSSLDYRSKCSSQYFILSPWDLIIISTRLPIEDIVLSMVSIGTLYRAFRILATNSSRLSFVIFFADFRRSLFARWNTFSMGLRSGLLGGMWNTSALTRWRASLAFFEFWDRSPFCTKYQTAIIFVSSTEHVDKVSLNEVSKVIAIKFIILFTDNDALFSSFGDASLLQSFTFLAPHLFLGCTNLLIGMGLIHEINTIKVECYSFCPNICWMLASNFLAIQNTVAPVLLISNPLLTCIQIVYALIL